MKGGAPTYLTMWPGLAVVAILTISSPTDPLLPTLFGCSDAMLYNPLRSLQLITGLCSLTLCTAETGLQTLWRHTFCCQPPD